MREMKDSGIPWIGEIPKDWETHRLKSVFSSRVSGEWGDDAKCDAYDKVCLRIADFDYKRLRFKQCESYTIRNYSKSDDALPYLHKGDILIEKSGGGEKTPVGRAVVYDLDFDKAMYANFMTRLRVKPNTNSWFVEYLLSTLYSYGALNIYIKQTTGIQNLDITTMLEEEKIFLPSLAEQQRIAEFLDRKCAEVDEMIGLQEQIIEELKAYKQSVITEAVTKGLNPDAPMRDSGIEWIGEIPEHWEVKRLKNVVDLNPTFNAQIEQDTLVAYMPMECLRNGIIQERIAPYSEVASYTPFKDGDVVMAKVTPCFENGNIAVATNLQGGYGFGTSEIFVIRCGKEAHNKYAFYYLQSAYIKNLGVSSMTGTGGLKRVNPTILNNSYFLSPSVAEQQAIADYLDEKCADIDRLIQTKQSKIDSLKEYKKSIIYEYVTGKREVE